MLWLVLVVVVHGDDVRNGVKEERNYIYFFHLPLQVAEMFS